MSNATRAQIDQTNDEQDPERNLGRCLHRSRDRSVTRRLTHGCLPRGASVTHLYAVVDCACVARRSVKALSQVFEEDENHVVTEVRVCR